MRLIGRTRGIGTKGRTRQASTGSRRPEFPAARVCSTISRNRDATTRGHSICAIWPVFGKTITLALLNAREALAASRGFTSRSWLPNRTSDGTRTRCAADVRYAIRAASGEAGRGRHAAVTPRNACAGRRLTIPCGKRQQQGCCWSPEAAGLGNLADQAGRYAGPPQLADPFYQSGNERSSSRHPVSHRR